MCMVCAWHVQVRLGEEATRLSNELVDLRFRHWLADDAASAAEKRVAHVDALLARSASDRGHIEHHGCAPAS